VNIVGWLSEGLFRTVHAYRCHQIVHECEFMVEDHFRVRLVIKHPTRFFSGFSLIQILFRMRPYRVSPFRPILGGRGRTNRC
jgi:hypothetical protein